ncbi:hypothetical protein, partial [Zooshikella sp. RANM57]|uniref:hypothetical protein n=1 Tax=Zooshikella sp. RANM57 TaxID=3425863 RepID=UPI003D6FFACE
GTFLTVPNKVTNIHNNSSTFRPYNAGVAIGDVSPTLPDMPPPPIKAAGGGCGGAAMVVMVVVAVVAAWAAAAAFSALSGAVSSMVGSAVTATTGSAVAGTAMGAAAGFGAGVIGAGITSQAITQAGAIAMGQQSGFHFSWKDVARDGLMAAASVGVEQWAGNSANAVANAKTTGESISTMQKVGNAVKGSKGYMAAAKATARQLVSSAMDREHKFSWKSVAASAIGAELGGAVSSTIGAADWGGKFGEALTESVVSSAVDAKVFGNKFNFKNAARQAVGQAIGASLTKTFDGWMNDDPRDQQAPQKASAQQHAHSTQSKSSGAVVSERGQGRLEKENLKRLRDDNSSFYQLSSTAVQESIVLDERKGLEESLEGQAGLAWLAKYGLASNGAGGTPPVTQDEYNENYKFYQLDSSYALSTHKAESVGYGLGDSRLPNRSSDIKERNLWERIVRSWELMTEVFSNASNSSSGFIGAALGGDVWVNDQKGFQSGWTGSKGDWFGLAKTSGNFLSSIAFSYFPSGEHQMVSEFFTPGEDEIAGSKVFMQYGLPAATVALVLTPAGKKAFGKLSFRSKSYQNVEGLYGWHPREYSYKYNGELNIPSFSGSGYAFNNVSLSTAYTINTGIIDGGYGKFAFVPNSKLLSKADIDNHINSKWNTGRWDHVHKGDFVNADGVWKLEGGMHTREAFDEFIKLNAQAGKQYKTTKVTRFDEFNNTADEIFIQELPNGATRVQLPKDGAFKNAKARNNALAYNSDGSKVKGVKTLLPSGWTSSNSVSATDNILANNANKVNFNSYSSKWVGTEKNISITIQLDNAGKVNTFYPNWRQ